MFRAHGYLILFSVADSADFFLSVWVVALVPSYILHNRIVQ